jgi:AAA+ superfamily predicted ATPase
VDRLVQELLLSYRAGYGLVLVTTHEEDRALVAAQQAADQVQVPLTCWTGTEEETALAEAAQAYLQGWRSLPGGAVLLLPDLVPLFREAPALVRTVREVAQQGPGQGKALWLVSPRNKLPEELTKDAALVDLPLPTPEELRHGLDQVCAEQAVLFDEDFLQALVRAAGGLTLSEARRVFRKALVAGGGHRLENVDIVIEHKRRILRQGSALEAYPLQWSLSDVGGLDELKRWLKERKRAFAPEARAFGLPEPRGLLLMGVQGCGKSLSAKAVAGLWQLPLLRLDLAELFGATHPEGELRRAVKVAEAMSPAVLWVDEIDKAFAAPKAGTNERLLGILITWLQEKQAPVFVVATANEVDRLPPELTRRGRFDAVFFVDLPDVHERKEILALHLFRLGRQPEQFPLADVAEQTAHFAGSELEQVVIGALYRAFAQQRELTGEDLAQEAQELVPLYAMYEERIKGLRQWAKSRARPATLDRSKLDLFQTEPRE